MTAVYAAYAFAVPLWTIAIVLAGIVAFMASIGGMAALIYFLTRSKKGSEVNPY